MLDPGHRTDHRLKYFFIISKEHFNELDFFTWFGRHDVAYHNHEEDNHNKDDDAPHQRYQGHSGHADLVTSNLTDCGRHGQTSSLITRLEHRVIPPLFFFSFEAALS